jgi:hypothetical protein
MEVDTAIPARDMVVAARLRDITGNVADTVVGTHRADARTAEAVGILAVAAEVTQAAVDTLAVAEVTAVAAIAKFVKL